MAQTRWFDILSHKGKHNVSPALFFRFRPFPTKTEPAARKKISSRSAAARFPCQQNLQYCKQNHDIKTLFLHPTPGSIFPKFQALHPQTHNVVEPLPPASGEKTPASAGTTPADSVHPSISCQKNHISHPPHCPWHSAFFQKTYKKRSPRSHKHQSLHRFCCIFHAPVPVPHNRPTQKMSNHLAVSVFFLFSP